MTAPDPPSSAQPQIRRTFAVLVDGDHIPPEVLQPVLAEVERHGEARIRLVFGGEEALKGRKEQMNRLGFRPMLQYAVANRKNATDIALTISALELHGRGDIDAYCIVSSDSDFKPLATWLREHGQFVLGIGPEATSPDALKSACHVFSTFETLPASVLFGGGKTPTPTSTPGKDSVRDLDRLRPLLLEAYTAVRGPDGWAALSSVGTQLRNLEPDFSPSKYGRRQLWKLAEGAGLFQFRPQPPAPPNTALYVRAKG